jgi:snRNA-activating protein complex subunit 1
MCVCWNFTDRYYSFASLFMLTESSQTIDVEDVRHILQHDKLLGEKVDEAVKQWDAQKEEFYEKTGLSHGNELAVIDNDESVLPHEDDGFDEITQLLLE